MPPTLPRGGPGADVKGPLSEWVVKERVRQGIKARFLNFLLTARNKAYRCAAIHPSIHSSVGQGIPVSQATIASPH